MDGDGIYGKGDGLAEEGGLAAEARSPAHANSKPGGVVNELLSQATAKVRAPRGAAPRGRPPGAGSECPDGRPPAGTARCPMAPTARIVVTAAVKCALPRAVRGVGGGGARCDRGDFLVLQLRRLLRLRGPPPRRGAITFPPM